ncbi:MAG: exodeoxyribonuclease V subunit beta [Gammaproteobacteria bacterium HGW-Gammaproteobacteria-3]|nr:MAG: exodeoxyribonuclease V subunit beta [Gammaproteobacteria bacterium HGW-Gammaproteobacteria-3]
MTTAIPLDPLTFPLSGTRLIEASAGTGKTYTIAALYVRLILGHSAKNETPGRNLLPPEILVLTFTEAATQELRERIRDRLSQSARFFRGRTDTSDAFLEALRADYEPRLWPGNAWRLEQAANWMDEAAVYTLHGWCNRMLQQHAFDSGSLFRQEVNTDDSELLHEVVRDYWRVFYYGFSNDDADFQTLYNLFKQPDDLFGNIRAFAMNSDPVPACLAPGQDLKAMLTRITQARQTALQALKQPWQQWAGEIKDLIDTAVTNKVLPAKNYNAANRRNWINKIITWSTEPSEETLDIGKGFENLTPEGLAKLAKPGQTPPQHPAFAALAELPRQLASLPNLKIELIKHAIHWVRQRYDSEKQRIARMTFNDMLTRLDKALQGSNGPNLANIIRQQYPIALIDEFQDTDPVQYRILSTLYPPDAASQCGFFMIGDPKQAIYSFRGADIHTYLKAHRDTRGRHYTLDTNYRSTKDFVEAVNQLFEQADKQDTGAFRFKRGVDNPLPYLPVAAKGREQAWVIDNQTAPSLTVWHWDSSEAVSLGEYRDTMAEIAATEIVRLLNLASQNNTGFKSTDLKPLQPSDIAILVRTGHEARTMRKALAQRQVRSVYLSERDSIFATREASDLLLWLKALAEPRNESKVRAALSCATLGWPIEALQQLAQDEAAWETHLERFLGYQARWQQDGILPALRQLISDYELHVQLDTNSESERRITNVLHLAELLQQASAQLEGEQALIRYLAEAMAASSAEADDEGIIRLESDANLIKIITIHKSKGLEYPLVFLPFICSFREVTYRFSTHYRYHDDRQNLAIDLHKDEANRVLSDEERLQEDLRLLYVALTRARHACWLGIAPVKSGNTRTCQLEKSAIGSLLNWQPGLAASALTEKLAQLKGRCLAIAISPLPNPNQTLYRPPQHTDQLEAARVASGKVGAPWWVASYSALQIEQHRPAQNHSFYREQEPETAQDDKRSDESEFDTEFSTKPQHGLHACPKGAEAGVLIHDLLEQCAHSGFSSMLENPERTQELIQKRFSFGEWANKHDIIAEGLSHWLNMPLLEGSTVSLSQLDADSYQAELEFLMGADTVNAQALDSLVTHYTFPGQVRPAVLPTQVNGLLKGFIDLVFVHEQRYYIVDYKFNSLGHDAAAYTSEALQAAMLAKRYDLQYSLYLLALHRLLKARLGLDYDYDRHIGGSLYWFLRGAQSPTGGRVFDKPPSKLILGMDELFSSSNVTVKTS